ncbi:MAG: virulence RhuM family protein [Bacteroidetes bacterium]|nr:virulence RhuM family protein [Bacteroidota bacterium]
MNENVEQTNFIFYHGEDGATHVQVVLGKDSVWATQTGMAGIFGIDRSGITKHIKNIFDDGELIQESNVQILHIANSDKPVTIYSLDVIIAVGYRVNSYKATKFRIWATKILREYLIKGFVLDDERLKQGNRLFGKDYFKELLERIREIRASERMFYEKVTDLYATSVDYDKTDPDTHKFFAKVQNKLEYAVTGKTSAEIIRTRADATLPHMGLKTWKNAKRDGKIQKSDTTIAKNYLREEEIKELNRLVNMYLDYAEGLVEKHKLMTMTDWSNRLDAFLRFNEYKILDNSGSISKAIADSFAEGEYAKFRVEQDKNYISDFNVFVDELKTTNRLPSEAVEKKEEESQFDKHLKGLLKTPPPKK